MTWPKNIEQWRQYAVWEGRDIPPDIVLAIIAHESGGMAGRLSTGTTKSADIEKADGTTVTMTHAMGLMQVIPPNVASWNSSNSEKAYWDDMTGSNERACRLQIRLGCWIYATNVRLLNQYDSALFPGASPGSATPEQLKLALVSYAIGFGNLKPKMEELKDAGDAVTLENLAKRFPNWGYSLEQGRWINRPLRYAQVVWSNLGKYGTGKPGRSVPSNPLSLPDIGTIKKAAEKLKDDWLWIVLALVGTLLFAQKKPDIIDIGKSKIISRK